MTGKNSNASLIPPCQNACPIHQDVRGYIALMAQGRLEEALQVIRETNPLPSICGTICAHPCEDKCRRREIDKALSIRGLKRFVVEHARSQAGESSVKSGEERIAIIGSGPAGLTAAHDLAMMGYRVTIFEREDTVGGAIHLAIPAYRLPTSTIQRDIDAIAALGVEFRSGVELGKNLTLDGLKEEGYRATLLSMGLPESRSLPIPGIDLEGVLLALPFLKAARNGKSLISPGAEVIVVGGGNVAMDVARTARRFGAGAVRVVCLESREEMPASPWEIDEALEEGIEIDSCSQGPNRVVESGGKITGLECKACLCVFDEEGRFNPSFCEEDLSTVRGGVVILSIGQGANIDYLADMGVALNHRGQLICDRKTFATSRDGVFACGEVITGPGLAVEAMASGRQAALAIAHYLEGTVPTPEPEPTVIGDLLDTVKVGIRRQERREVPLLDAEERWDNFAPIELGYTEEMAVLEARRCLSCGAGAEWLRDKCAFCLNCVRVCPYEVPVITESGSIDIRVEQCQACGICYGACPGNAIAFKMLGVAEIQHRMETALQNTLAAGTDCPILVLYCDFDIYNVTGLRRLMAEKHAGAACLSVPCLAKLRAVDLLRAFEFGAGGVLVIGCPAEECTYQGGEIWAQRRVDEGKILLAQIGMDADRLQLHYVSGLKIDEFDRVLAGFKERVKSLSMTKA
ncbi:MAG: NADPH-Fe(3+) oxidoreductase subunit beta [Dehalococcoidia bacterium]|nr:NADPH-Fe(3+) oxidoreductase subunit beta [Chloroflexota bacterium]